MRLEGSISIVKEHAVIAAEIPVTSFNDIASTILSNEWTPAKFSKNHRNLKNVTSVDFMVYDIDANHSLYDILSHFKSTGWAHQISTTRNHMKLKNGVIGPRVRVVVPFTRAVSAEEYTAIHEITTKNFPVDKACKDACHYFYPSTAVLVTEPGTLMLVDDLIRDYAPALAPASTTGLRPTRKNQRGVLSNKTTTFLAHWQAIKHTTTWHQEFIFAVRDLASQNFTYAEAEALLTTVTGHLDSDDHKQLKDRWSCNKFVMDFRPKSRRNSNV